MNYDFKNKPGVELLEEKYEKLETVISIIFPIVEDNKMNQQSIKSILNQTYPNFELIIIGNKKPKIVDKRIKYVNKNVSCLLQAYNYGVKESNKKTQYYVFFKEGNLLEKTYLETVYWSLITHPKASWGFTNSVIYSDVEKENMLLNEYYHQHKLNSCPLFMIKKEAYDIIQGFDTIDNYALGMSMFLKKAVNKALYPVHSSWYLNWMSYDNYKEYYKSSSKIKSIKLNNNNLKKENHPIQFPIFSYNYETIDKCIDNLITPHKVKNKKINILMIVPWIIIGGADIFNLELIKRLDKDKFSVTLLSTEPYINNLRQKFENICDVYDITSFLEIKDYIPFINYLIEKNNINMFFNTSSLYGYSILPYLKAKYPQIPIVDYIHMEEWYNRNGGYSRSSTMVESVIDQTWVCNSVTEEIMSDYFKRAKEEVKTVYIGVDTEKFNPSKYNTQELRKKYGLKTDKKIIGYICRISEQKRPLLLADIIDNTLAERDDVLFLIVGDGSMLNTLKDRINKYKNNVKFLPSTNNTPEMYALCDITINCSIKEGLALTAYESLSMGVPVISADVGGQRELVDKDVGKLVKCYQEEKEIMNFNYTKEEINEYVVAIREVIPKLNELKLNCRKKILNKFTLDQMGQNMSDEFIRVFNNPNKNKISTGISLSKSLGITKELIVASIMEDKDKTNYQCNDFYNKVYHIQMGQIRMIQRIKNKLLRKLTKSKIWKIMKKILKRG